jgi:anti-sigma B factor antagonist
VPDTAVSAPGLTALTVEQFVSRRVDIGDAVWLTAFGELDLAAAPELAELLLGAQTDAMLVVLDLRGLTFMDSGGVHVILRAAQRARRTGRRLVVVRGQGQVERLLGLVNVDEELELVGTARAGLALSRC